MRFCRVDPPVPAPLRSEEHTSELQSRLHLVCRLLLEKKNNPCSLEPGCCPRQQHHIPIIRSLQQCTKLNADSLTNLPEEPSQPAQQTHMRVHHASPRQ